MLFARYIPNTPAYSLAALNFTDTDQQILFWLPVNCDYKEELHGEEETSPNLSGISGLLRDVAHHLVH